MRVTNHNKGNFHYCGTDSSVMYGSIFMASREWKTVKAWLWERYKVARDNDQTYQRDSLHNVVEWDFMRNDQKINEPFCIGVEATRLMFEAFGLPHYKKQNYSITIKL